MIIEIPLGGQIRIIKWDGIQFIPYPLNGNRLLGYYTSFGKAVEKLVKDVANTDEIVNKQLKEDRLSIGKFVDRFDRILSDINRLTPESFQNIPSDNEEEIMDVEFENESRRTESLETVDNRIIETRVYDDLDDL